jgi:hypothetical protein
MEKGVIEKASVKAALHYFTEWQGKYWIFTLIKKGVVERRGGRRVIIIA